MSRRSSTSKFAEAFACLVHVRGRDMAAQSLSFAAYGMAGLRLAAAVIAAPGTVLVFHIAAVADQIVT